VGANVTLTNVARGISATRITGEAGHYIFDMTEPGTYTLTVETAGFATFRAESIVLEQRGDITVDATLVVSTVNSTVEVSAQAAQVQFNTSRFETTVDSQLTGSLPQFFRDPFFLSKADPAVSMNDTRRENQPFYSTGAASQVVGGATTPDLQVDGARVGIGTRTAYVPPPDSVQDVNVQISAVDAEYGYSGQRRSLFRESRCERVVQSIRVLHPACLHRAHQSRNVRGDHRAELFQPGPLDGQVLPHREVLGRVEA
jgi:hypothetical protein